MNPKLARPFAKPFGCLVSILKQGMVSDLFNLFLRQLCRIAQHSFAVIMLVASLGTAISNVGTCVSQEKMRRVNTTRPVAFMKHVLAGFNPSEIHHPGSPASCQRAACPRRGDLPITSPLARSGPVPASSKFRVDRNWSILVYFRPKSFPEFIRNLNTNHICLGLL